MQPIRGQGVYAIVNYKLETLYIGSSSDLATRSRNWLDKIRRRHPEAEKFTRLCAEHEQWKFVVLRPTISLSHSELRAAEAQAIREATEKGMNLLNTNIPASVTMHTLDGLTGSVAYHAARYGLLGNTVAYRMAQGMSLREAIDTPKLHNASRIKMMAVRIIGAEGSHISVADAARHLNENAKTLHKRLKRLRDKNPALKEITVAELARRAR